MGSDNPNDPVFRDALYRIKRGLCGYVSYLAACEMNQAFSEYVLYEPILRILKERGFNVECEYVCPGIDHAPVGDKRRIDFFATKGQAEFALEVKWAKDKKLAVASDVQKLTAIAQNNPSCRSFLCVFGVNSVVGVLSGLPGTFREWGKPIVADFRKTRFCCRVFVLR